MTPDVPAPDDQALMRALRDGDDRALNELMARWERPLRGFLFRWTRHPADATDLAQETFVRVHQHRARFRDGAKFSTWLFQIALNLARDHARRAQRRPTTALESAPEPSASGTPQTALLDAERSAAVQGAIAELPDDLREAVLLFEYAGKSHAEIAEIVRATPKAVETRLYRARAHLRQRLARFLADSPATAP